jgi:hypothetical protein
MNRVLPLIGRFVGYSVGSIIITVVGVYTNFVSPEFATYSTSFPTENLIGDTAIILTLFIATASLFVRWVGGRLPLWKQTVATTFVSTVSLNIGIGGDITHAEALFVWYTTLLFLIGAFIIPVAISESLANRIENRLAE